MRRALDRCVLAVSYPRSVPVYMNHSNILHVDSNVKREKTISTLGLRGCLVNVLYMKNEDSQMVIMTHFHPNLLEEHGDELLRQITGNSRLKEYSYGHNIVIYPNGRSFFVKSEMDLAMAYQRDEAACLQEILDNSKKTRDILHSIVRENVSIAKLDTSFIPYVQEPNGMHGIGGQACEVHVTVSNKRLSFGFIHDMRKSTFYLGDDHKTRGIVCGRTPEQLATMICVSPEEKE
jgi:hypothetical protein